MGFFKNKLRGLAVWSACMLMAACQTDVWVEQERGLALKEGEIALQWLPANMGVHRVTTRGTDPKTALEQEIKNVHVFIFTAEGKYLAADGSDAFQGYRYMEGNQNLVLNSELFASQPDAEDACVYVLANFPKDAFGEIGNDGRPANVANRDALEEMTFELPDFTATLPETGLPMVLRQDNVNLSTDATEKIILLQLRSMMARIDLNFTMEPEQYGEDSRNPSLRITEVRVGNFPKGGTIVPQLESTTATTETTETTGSLIENPVIVKNWDGLEQPIRRNGNEVSLTLYMFEHSRQAKALDEIFDEGNYPDNITDAEKQRYKNALAKEDAAYVELEGTYTTQNELVYHIIYRIYVGANPENDFTIKPNCQYKNNIVITGITVNNRDPELEALLDTRVDVDSDPAFIEMLREQMFDAHFNVTPMDIYLREKAESVTVTILNENGQPASADEMTWIRMEPYCHAPEGKCEYKEGDYAATKAGDGKRKYFTTNLLSEMNNGYNRSYTVTQPEERIYFYMDENVPTQEQASRGENVSPRSVKVLITYKAEDGNESSQIATFRQAGMRSVRFDKFTGNYGLRRKAYFFYIEEYEEYLAHYDGKNAYTETYEGMEWGLDGLETGLGVKDGYDFWQYMSWGWYNTDEIMKQCRVHDSWESVEGRQNEEMTLNTKPSGAAEYCYNKNKRNENGTVERVEWYLPTISELEYAIDKYYGIYEVFQDKWYWSSNPGAIGDPNNNYTGNAGEDRRRARATKSVLKSGNTFEHAVSAANEKYEDGTGGSAYRTNKFRVRAAYIPENNKPDDVNPDRNWS